MGTAEDKRARMVGRPVSREKVLSELGDPSTWERDRLAHGAQLKAPYRKNWRSLLPVLIAFSSGVVYEAGCVFWVHFAERKDVGAAVTFSCLNAIVTISGVEAFLKSRASKIAYVVGCGTGTFLALAMMR